MRTDCKIGTGQLFCLLILSRIMFSMLYHTKEFAAGTPLMWAQLAVTAVELVLAIPLLIFLTKGQSISEMISSKLWVQRIIEGLYTLYFVLLFANMLSDFMGFMGSKFSGLSHPLIVGGVLALCCAYAASLGIQGLSRGGGVLLWLVLLFIVGMALLSEGEIRLEYVTPMSESDLPIAVAYGMEELSSNWWLPMAACLGEYTKKSAWKAGLWYLVFKLIFVEGLIFLVTVILWQYMNVAEYPILALGSYARTDFIQQFDGVNLLFWTANALVVGGSFVFSSVKRAKNKLVPYGAAAAAFALAWLVFCGVLPFPDRVIRITGAILLGSILPLAAIISRKADER